MCQSFLVMVVILLTILCREKWMHKVLIINWLKPHTLSPLFHAKPHPHSLPNAFPPFPDAWRHFPCLLQATVGFRPRPPPLPDALHHFPHSRMHDVTSHAYYRPLLASDHTHHHCRMRCITSSIPGCTTSLPMPTMGHCWPQTRPPPLPDALHHFPPFPDAWSIHLQCLL